MTMVVEYLNIVRWGSIVCNEVTFPFSWKLREKIWWWKHPNWRVTINTDKTSENSYAEQEVKETFRSPYSKYEEELKSSPFNLICNTAAINKNKSVNNNRIESKHVIQFEFDSHRKPITIWIFEEMYIRAHKHLGQLKWGHSTRNIWNIPWYSVDRSQDPRSHIVQSLRL